MSIKTICKILDTHGVPYLIQDGRVLADSMEAFTPIFSEVIDVTTWNRDELYSWLGY
jgi:hypothetical protein